MDSDEEMDSGEENDVLAQSDDEFDALVVAAAIVATRYYDLYISKEPRRDCSYKGMDFVMHIVSGNDKVCYELLRMEKHVFLKLCKTFRERRLLEDSRGVCIEEQLAIFLMIIGHNERNNVMQERFQHSGETIHRHFHRVLQSVAKFSMSIIVPPSFDEVPSHIRSNSKYWPFFKDCIGAIDGTHVDAFVPLEKQTAYRGRNGLTQNVMVACSFDMRFTFVYAGWEGTTNDSRILLKAINNPELNFPHAPPGKYYLVDAGYPNMTGFLAPFHGVRYHQSDFRYGPQPRGIKELFNHTHSSLRNIVERCFSVLKKRWSILKGMPPYSLQTQMFIVVACMAIHNFIRQESMVDEEFAQYDNEEYVEEDEPRLPDDLPDPDRVVQSQSLREMELVRSAIANDILAAHQPGDDVQVPD